MFHNLRRGLGVLKIAFAQWVVVLKGEMPKSDHKKRKRWGEEFGSEAEELRSTLDKLAKARDEGEQPSKLDEIKEERAQRQDEQRDPEAREQSGDETLPLP